MQTSLLNQGDITNEERKRWVREVTHRVTKTVRKKERREKREVTRTEIESRIQESLTGEMEACDLLMSLFCSALFSFRRSSICDPFPDEFDGPERNYDDAELYVNGFPEIQKLAKQVNTLSNLPLPALKLLNWVVNPFPEDGFRLKNISLDRFQKMVSFKPSGQSHNSAPTQIFEVVHDTSVPKYNKFLERKAKYGVIIGYHGSTFENFHSILRNGLDATFSKQTSIYGEGIYLSEDRDVAYNFLKCGRNYASSSIFGERVGCLACCEILRHPKVRRAIDQTSQPGILVDGESHLPKGYIVVTDNDHVLVKHILVYSDYVSTKPGRHKKLNLCFLIIILYTFILIGIWMWRSNMLYRVFSKQPIEL